MAEQKALVLDSKKGSFVLVNRPSPKPGPGELLSKFMQLGFTRRIGKSKNMVYLLKTFPPCLVLMARERWRRLERVLKDGPKAMECFFTNDQANAFQQYTLVLADIAAKIPENISYSQAASIPGLFAHGMYGQSTLPSLQLLLVRVPA